MNEPRPEWIRLPKPGTVCPYTGIGRTVMDRLAVPSPRNNHNAPVKSASLRQPGQKKATRLIHLPSLLAYIEKHAEQPAEAAVLE